jgi:hypothetical protein
VLGARRQSMRTLAVLLGLLLVAPLAGCVDPGVYGTGPVKACGRPGEPGVVSLSGVKASWVGTEFIAQDDSVSVWIQSGQADVDVSWFGDGTPVQAWLVVALEPQGPVPAIRAAKGDFGRYDVVHAGLQVGPAKQDMGDADAVSPPGGALLEPIQLSDRERLFIYAATDVPVESVNLLVEWTGCAEARKVVGGLDAGGVYGWDDLDASARGSSMTGGAIAYDAQGKWDLSEGLVVAHAPSGSSQTLYEETTLTDDQGTRTLNETYEIHPHFAGPLDYATTYAGGGDAAATPLVAWFPLKLFEMEGAFRQECDGWFGC